MLNYSLPPQLDKEIDDLESLLEKYKRGEISVSELKARRVPFGVYEQRQRDTYMVRVRAAGGCLTPLHLEEIAALSSKYGADKIHLTTRQEIQIHYVRLENIVAIMRRLREIGLSSRGGGGNTVRNITVQEDAGVDPQEVFDVTPYAIALTSRLLAEGNSWTLPRKFKVAFSGSGEDKGYATVADVGFIAAAKEGQRGFRVYVAGGMGAKSQAGNLLFDFIPAQDVYAVVEAVKTVFWKYGNRKNRHAARLRFLWQSLGEKEFRKKFLEEYEALRRRQPPALHIEVNDVPVPEIDLPEKKIRDQADFALWRKRFVRPQKQEGLHFITVPVELGFIANERAVKLARLLRPFGDNVLRMTKDQNFLIRNIAEKHLGWVYGNLKDIVESFNRPIVFDKILSCAGASTCQLGICLSRGAARAIMKTLRQDKSLDPDALSDIKINISGCPNSCGQHLLADLGFFGKAARKGERLYPAYNVVAGAVIKDARTKFAEIVGDVSARDLPRLVTDHLRRYLSEAAGYKNYGAYFQREGRDDLKRLCDKYSRVPDFQEDKNYYFDWESDKPFSLAERGSGECSAGLFDLIEIDLENIRQTKEKLAAASEAKAREKAAYLGELTFYASRMLLITRAVEPKTQQEVYENFGKYFIDTGLLEARFADVIRDAQDKNLAALLEKEALVFALADRVVFLYENMDNAFNFPMPAAQDKQQHASAPAADRPDAVKDLRGVVCPMNFVKTKMELSKMKSKEILEIWLDDGEPIENVPGSVREEGHAVLEQKKIGNYWSVVIQKK